MRIIAGKHRGAKLLEPADGAIRPTADRVRQALFDLLAHGALAHGALARGRGGLLRDAIVLDAFAGSGALGLEALSRGAARAILMDRDPAAITLAAANVKKLGLEAVATCLRADATRPPPSERAAGLVFLDPPYGEDLVVPALAALHAAGWIAPDAVIVVELDRRESFAPPPGFALADDRVHGRTRIVLLVPAA